MDNPQPFDVIIAGGGMAGAAVAAGLDGLGLRTLLVEPGLDSTKRLAGELIHPPSATDLADLGLLGAVEAAGGAPVHGFAVVGGGRSHVLPYARGDSVPSLLPWRGRRRLARRTRAAAGLSLATLRYAGEALWGLRT